MNSNPLFSVLIAQYNNRRFLQDAIDSVKAQTYINWEIILVDDASTDNSKEIYKLYENDERIKIYYNQENKGCGYTKRRCVELAMGELCGFLDPDDALLPKALDVMVNGHLQDENISLIYSNHVICDENLIQKYIFRSQEISSNVDNLHTFKGDADHFVSFKKILYNKTDGINSQFKRAIDKDLYYKLEEVGKLFFIDQPLYLYRIHNGGISTIKNIYKALYWHIKAIDMACTRRNIEDDAEVIVNEILINRFHNYIELLKLKLYQPSLRDVIGVVYRYIRNWFK
jgi:glycosyltransferase involved in cell wall biosynthesis